MDYNHLSYHKILWRKIYFSIFGLILIYTFFVTKNLWLPSNIVIHNLSKWNETSEQVIQLSGTMRNATSLQINDHLTTINKSGDFQEQLLLQDGYNKISIRGTSRFGKIDHKDLFVYYKKNS